MIAAPNVPAEELLSDTTKTTERRPLRVRSTSWKAWAIGGALLLFLLIAVTSRSVLNNVSQLDGRQDQVMENVRSQSEPVAQLSVPIAKSANLAPRDIPSLKATAAVPNGPLATLRSKPAANPQAPMIARAAAVTILVKDFKAVRPALEGILTQYGGYSANLTIDTPESGQRRFQASLRIPANQLDSALNDLKKLGITLNESQSGEEVTQQHADLIARLQNSRETEQRLRAILEQRTGKIDDVLQVEQEIARVRGEIESMESEQKALEHRISFATVELQLTEEFKEQFSSSPMSVGGRLRNAFVEGMRNASGTVLGLILFTEEFGPSFFIWSAILGLPVYFVWRRYRRIQASV